MSITCNAKWTMPSVQSIFNKLREISCAAPKEFSQHMDSGNLSSKYVQCLPLQLLPLTSNRVSSVSPGYPVHDSGEPLLDKTQTKSFFLYPHCFIETRQEQGHIPFSSFFLPVLPPSPSFLFLFFSLSFLTQIQSGGSLHLFRTPFARGSK